ncbi:hypothetical protein [Halohasta litorea]|uniref:Polyketide cyclase / dehydrase and lipid transport n=1 Tax=Halohasta litorea TaxID=869891 RepID=A0ABD6D713_9EURY|nr:hypothetical protein [Halohasta litorea]
MKGRRLATLVASLLIGWMAASQVGIYRVRLLAGQLLAAVPDAVMPRHFSVLPPPPPEYVGVWEVAPTEARRRLRSEFGFRRLVRAYFHCYDREGRSVHEVGSYVYRPDGLTSTHQLHVRLFPTADGRTELWCHWELNANVSPIAHLRRQGYDPGEGERRLRELLANEPISAADDGTSRTVADD